MQRGRGRFSRCQAHLYPAPVQPRALLRAHVAPPDPVVHRLFHSLELVEGPLQQLLGLLRSTEAGAESRLGEGRRVRPRRRSLGPTCRKQALTRVWSRSSTMEYWWFSMSSATCAAKSSQKERPFGQKGATASGMERSPDHSPWPGFPGR